MSTVIRPEITKKSKYYISKERYYELKHFCLQYKEWEESYNDILSIRSAQIDSMPKGNNISNPTERAGVEAVKYSRLMQIVKNACRDTAEDLETYIFMAVTEGRTYEYLRTVKSIPCCRDAFYDLYRRFFYILDRMRD